jgi:hypothetical protein
VKFVILNVDIGKEEKPCIHLKKTEKNEMIRANINELENKDKIIKFQVT